MPLFQPPLAPLPSDLSFVDKTIIVTGANAGLGFAATKHLLIHQAKEVIMAVRTTTRGENAKSQILADSAVQNRNPNGRITVMQLNLEDYRSVVSFVEAVKSRLDTLDMLLLNAGVGSLSWDTVSPSGHEKTIQVNLLSPALLALELVPLLERTAVAKGVPSRLTWVGSFVQFDHSLTKQPLLPGESILAHFDDKARFVPISRYPDSKMLSTLFVSQLAKHVDPKTIIVNDVSPGMVNSGFGDYPVWLRAIFSIVLWLRARSADVGARTYLHALGVVGKESHGAYLSDNHIAQRAPFATAPAGREVAQKLWEEICVECLNADGKLKQLSLLPSD